MSDLEILIDYYKAVDAKHITPTETDPLDCNSTNDCDFCFCCKACRYTGSKHLDGNPAESYQDTYFRLFIEPLMRKKDYSKENLEHCHPELFI